MALLLEAGRLEVFVQVGLERERFATSLAGKVLIRGMGLHMRPQVAPIRERLAAVRAPERFLARVRTQMSLEQPRPREQLPAYPARVR